MYNLSEQRRRRIEITVITSGLVLAIVLALIVVGCERGDRYPAGAGVSQPPLTTASPQTPTPTEDGPTAEESPTGDPDAGQSPTGDPDPGPGTDDPSADEGEDPLIELVPSPEDCVSYDPDNLAVQDLGATGWGMVDGSHKIAIFDTQADANDGVKVARNYTERCFIGRGNDRPDRYAYITTYFQSPSGLPFGPAPTLDCESYDPAEVGIRDAGEDGWRLTFDGADLPLQFDSMPDMARGRDVATDHTQLCFIGRGNDRPDPYRYIHEFWLG